MMQEEESLDSEQVGCLVSASDLSGVTSKGGVNPWKVPQKLYRPSRASGQALFLRICVSCEASFGL